MAFFQAGITALMVTLAAIDGTLLQGTSGFSFANLFDVIALSSLAVATLKRRIWGAYGLLAFGLLDVTMKMVKTGQVAWIVPPLLYLIGAVALQRSTHITPLPSDLRWRRSIVFALLWVAGNFIIGFVFGVFGLTHGGMPRDAGAAIAQAGLFCMWGTLVSYIAIRRASAPFEAALLIALVTVPFGLFDVLAMAASALILPSQMVWAVAFAMIGWWFTRLLPVRGQTVV